MNDKVQHSPSVRFACVQYCANDDLERNLRIASELIDKARSAGAQYIALPEACDFLSRNGMQDYGAYEEKHQALRWFREAARRNSAYLFVGSLTVKCSAEKLSNRSFVIDPFGEVIARYDKIHMFDADVGKGERFRESANYQPGELAVTVDLPCGRTGLSICYDLRFPGLYRSLAKAGASLFMIPAAFTKITGEAHWHVLQRARAIESGCFVIAAAQCGDPYTGRSSFGHSLIVDPWGRVLAEAGEGDGFIIADLDLNRVAEARSTIASLRHDRAYTGVNISSDRQALVSR